MRLPFSSSRNKTHEQSDSSRRSSVNEDRDSVDTSLKNGTDRSIPSEGNEQSNSVPVITPATSYSSYSSSNTGNGSEGKKAGMYELSGIPRQVIPS
jgi:hypothetical protein